MSKIKNKKALAAIISVMLLLITVVTSMIYLTNWYNTNQNNMLHDMDTKVTKNSVKLLDLNGNNLSIKNTNKVNINITQVKIGSTICSIVNTIIAPDEFKTIDLNGCVNSLTIGAYETVVYANEGIFTKVFMVSPLVSSLLFMSNISTINSGGSVNISWSSSHLTSCNASGNWSGSKNVSGSQIITNLISNVTYVLNCTGYSENIIKSVSIGVLIPIPEGCSSFNSSDWILVPALTPFTTNDFYVMKYESKGYNKDTGIDVDGFVDLATHNPCSNATGKPWGSIIQTDAIIECNSLNNGTGNYHLMTHDEWMSIARNVDQVASNWVGGALKRGNVGEALYAGYDGGNPSIDRVSDTNTLALMTLSNGKEIWDFSGNVEEMLNDTTGMHADWYDVFQNSGTWGDANINVEMENGSGPTNASWGIAEGMGRVVDTTSPSNTSVIIRGGRYNDVGNGGLYRLVFNENNYTYGGRTGFRCAYTP